MQEEDYAVLRSRGVEQLMASKEMKALRVAAQHKRLDLSDAFESSAGRGVNALIGEMPRNRFCSTLGGLFGGELKVSHAAHPSTQPAAGPTRVTIR